MNFTSDDVINSFGQVTGYSSAQAEQMFAKIKTSKAVANMTGADLLRLGTIALGITKDDIKNINVESFKYVIDLTILFHRHDSCLKIEGN